MPDLQALLARHRPALLRHCYRMLGAFADAEDLAQDALLRAWEERGSLRDEGAARGWLLAVATRACLDDPASGRRLSLPQADRPASPAGAAPGEELAPSRWLTPAPDARLFPDPQEAGEGRGSVALAFLAALQGLPAGERAALLLADVAGLPAEEVAGALGLAAPAASLALQRAREVVGAPPPAPAEPPPEGLRALVGALEARELGRLAACLRADAILSMPPYAGWLRGREAAAGLVGAPRFQELWRAGLRVALTRANGLPALGLFPAARGQGLHALALARFEGGQVAELTVFVGPHFFAGFELARAGG